MSRLVLTLFLALTGACASGGSAPPSAAPGAPPTVRPTSSGLAVRLAVDSVRSTTVFQAPLDTVWSRLPAVYEALGIPVQVTDPGTWTFGNRRFTARNLAGKRSIDLMYCGHEGAGPSAVRATLVRLSVVSALRRLASGDTELTTEVTGTSTPMDGTSTASTRCVSNGELEQRIADAVRAQLGSGGRDETQGQY